MNPDQGTGIPQFDKVEYQVAPGSSACVLCNQPISGSYYRINGEQACSTCAEKERAAQRDSAKNYSRAVFFGIGAAIVGLIGYATFEIVTGWIIGYLSLGVGWLIAKSMLKGSNGQGGRKYQITAVLLTYFAVSMAAIPVFFSLDAKQKKTAPTQAASSSSTENSQPAQGSPAVSNEPAAAQLERSESENANAAAPVDKAQAASQPSKTISMSGFLKAIGVLFLVGLASPFLALSDGVQGFIGLFILFIGLRIAWTMTARPRLIIDGPF